MGVKDIIDESFVGGTVYQGFLSPWCYHCWHSPVDGYIEKAYKIPGCYLQQNPSFDVSGNSNYADSQVFLSCVSARFVFIIQTKDPRVGRVAIIYIGMT
jgi:phosphatidylserine decarboxylase